MKTELLIRKKLFEDLNISVKEVTEFRNLEQSFYSSSNDLLPLTEKEAKHREIMACQAEHYRLVQSIKWKATNGGQINTTKKNSEIKKVISKLKDLVEDYNTTYCEDITMEQLLDKKKESIEAAKWTNECWKIEALDIFNKFKRTEEEIHLLVQDAKILSAHYKEDRQLLNLVIYQKKDNLTQQGLCFLKSKKIAWYDNQIAILDAFVQ